MSAQWRPIGERRWRDGAPPSPAERYETREAHDDIAAAFDYLRAVVEARFAVIRVGLDMTRSVIE